MGSRATVNRRVAREQLEVRSEGRPEFQPDTGTLGSDLDGSWRCTGAEEVLHWHTLATVAPRRYRSGLTGIRLALHDFQTSTRLVLRWYCAGAGIGAVFMMSWGYTRTTPALCSHCTGTALTMDLVYSKYYTGAALVLY